MSILIKDVKAPRDCASCKMPMEICSLWVGTEPGIKHQDCPIVELPEKHGRLIDEDALMGKIDRAFVITHSFDAHQGFIACQRMIRALPTIIPAEPEEARR